MPDWLRLMLGISSALAGSSKDKKHRVTLCMPGRMEPRKSDPRFGQSCGEVSMRLTFRLGSDLAGSWNVSG